MHNDTNSRSGSSSSSSSSGSKKLDLPTGNKKNNIDGTSSSAIILGSNDDIFGKDCTHVILHSSSSK